jgi:hypothetical protein
LGIAAKGSAGGRPAGRAFGSIGKAVANAELRDAARRGVGKKLERLALGVCHVHVAVLLAPRRQRLLAVRSRCARQAS